MPVYKGTAISGSVFVGKVKVYKTWQLPSYPKTITKSQVKSELKKLKSGINQLEADIKAILQDPDISQLDKDILNTHLMIVTDIEITQILENAVINNLSSAPYAVSSTFETIISNFEQMENNYFAQRADDYKDIAQRLLNIILQVKERTNVKFKQDDIVFLHEITPSLVSRLAKVGVKAYCTEQGSHTSHSSILSRAMGLTAIVAGEEIIHKLKDGDPAILDAESNKIIINPSAKQISNYNIKLQALKKKEDYLKTQLDLPTITKTKVNIQIKANIEYPGEADNVLDNKCEGIGLFRTEFIYLNRVSLPEEEEQTKVYSALLKKLNNLPVIIRTFDLGGDKLSYMQQFVREENPFLGCRGIRFSLQQTSLFKTQVRAILRASVHGKVSIMFPMIISMDDFVLARELVSECQSELKHEGLEFDKTVPIGAMIETPSAALSSEHLAKVCDFFSLGTNDLVQYTLAVDRNNDKVAPYYIQHHPAVLMLIKQTILSAKTAGIPVSICGEMASELMYVPLLIGLGINEISINPAKTPAVKAVIRNCDKKLFEIIANFDFNTSIADIEHLLKHTLKRYYTIQS